MKTELVIEKKTKHDKAINAIYKKVAAKKVKDAKYFDQEVQAAREVFDAELKKHKDLQGYHTGSALWITEKVPGAERIAIIMFSPEQ